MLSQVPMDGHVVADHGRPPLIYRIGRARLLYRDFLIVDGRSIIRVRPASEAAEMAERI